MNKKIKIIKNRSDLGAGTRGSDMGIDAIEIAAINKGSDYFSLYSFKDVDTINEAIYNKQKAKFALRIENVLKVCTNLANDVKDAISDDFFPIVISGDHSSALGTISGIKMAHPNKRLGVVWIDAHADVHSPYTTPSGNIHGMPLSAALADNNLDRKINDLTENTDKHWENMKNIGGIAPKIVADDLIYFGVRDTEEPEDYFIEKNNIKNYKVAEVRYRGMEVCLQESIEKLKDCDHIYISFDVDSMDCDLISKGTGTPVSKGFDQQEITEIINGFIETNKVASVEIVEINPCLDNKGNKMAETAFEVLENITDTLEKNLSLN
jgi:arginase